MRLLVGLLAVWLLVVIGAVQVWRSTSPESVLEQQFEAAVPLALTSQKVKGSLTLSISIDDISRFEVRTPRAGTVTSVSTAGLATSGRELMTIDDYPLIAFAADAPLSAIVSSSSPGASIARAQRFLAALGYYPSDLVDNKYGPLLRQAASAFNTYHALPRASRSLDPRYLAWIGLGETMSFTPTVAVGDIVASGDVVGIGPVTAASALVDEVGNVSALTANAELRGNRGAIEFRYRQGSSEVPEETAIQLAQEGVTEVVVVVSLSDPVEVQLIPAQALIEGRAGSACLLVRDGQNRPWQMVSATVLGQEPGIILVRPLAEAEVLTNPWILDEYGDCP